MDSKHDFGWDRFRHVLTTEAELRDVVGPANRWFTSKIMSALDRACRRFIASSPFVVIASTGADGHVDLSPKGDAAGFVRIIDNTTLAIPDRPGNRRLDTFRNVLQTANVGLIFLVPGRRETLRVGGRARIVRDAEVRASMSAGGRAPDLALVVGIERAFFQCGKCITRSRLWAASADEPAEPAMPLDCAPEP